MANPLNSRLLTCKKCCKDTPHIKHGDKTIDYFMCKICKSLRRRYRFNFKVKKKSDMEYQEVLKYREKGLSYEQIGKIYGLTRQRVFDFVKKRELKKDLTSKQV